MEGLLARHACSATAIQDMVDLKFGECHILSYYQNAFEIAAAVLQASKLAARFDGVDPRNGAAMAKAQQQEAFVPTSLVYRRSSQRANFITWSVAFEDKLVVLTFDQEAIKMPYDHAFKLYGWVRLAAKNAKRWSGDTSRQWTIRASLRDAEDNDKFVYVQ